MCVNHINTIYKCMGDNFSTFLFVVSPFDICCFESQLYISNTSNLYYITTDKRIFAFSLSNNRFQIRAVHRQSVLTPPITTPQQ